MHVLLLGLLLCRLNAMNEIWVPSEWQKESFAASGVAADKLVVVPEVRGGGPAAAAAAVLLAAAAAAAAVLLAAAAAAARVQLQHSGQVQTSRPCYLAR
jgi:hypothetical protein